MYLADVLVAGVAVSGSIERRRLEVTVGVGAQVCTAATLTSLTAHPEGRVTGTAKLHPLPTYMHSGSLMEELCL